MHNVFLLLLLLGLSGCHIGPQIDPPCLYIPETWKGNAEVCGPTLVGDWWELFGDPLLCDLESQAMANSPTLHLAMARVLEARAQVGKSRSALFPHLALQPSYSQMDSLFKVYLPQDLSSPFVTALEQVFRVNQFQYVLPFNLSYELDLWGKLRAQNAADWFAWEGEQEALRTAFLTLTSEVAQVYFQLRAFDTELDLLEATQRLRRKALQIAEQRFSRGLTGVSDVRQAELQLYTVDAEYWDIKRQRLLQENRLATLLGLPASDVCFARLPLSELPPAVPAGLPSDLLLQRPDLVKAERDMASKQARVGAAYASFFPSFDVTMTLGFSSPDLKHFLSWLSRLFALAVNANQPLFTGGELRSEYQGAWARFAQAESSYQQLVLQAFQEVEDALGNLELQAKQAESLDASVGAAREVYRVMDHRYQEGVANMLELVDSERSQLEAERSATRLLGVRYLSTVQLLKALGGSWDVSTCVCETAR